MQPIGRRAILAASVAISILLHVAIIAASPSFLLIGRSGPREILPERMRVRLLDASELERFQAPPGEPGKGLATRPGTISDLLESEREQIIPTENALTQQVDVPGLDRRIADDSIAMLQPDALDTGVEQHVDARIVEISQEAARQNIQIERRLVAPSSTRILPDGATPVLRGAADSATDELLMIDPLGIGVAGGGASAPGSESMNTPDPLNPGREAPMPEESSDVLRGLPDLPIEKVVARAPIVRSITENTRFDFIDDTVSMQLATYVPPGEREGYFRLQIVPKEGEALTPLPKDVTFVIDASNSILQRKLDQTVRGVQRSVAELREADRFNIVLFRDTPTFFQQELAPATAQNKAAAADFLKGVQSRGETNVYEGIRPVIQQTAREGIPGIIFVISDGKPTTGIRDGRTLINALTDENASRHSIYAFAGGRTVNQHLLDLLAYRNKGESSVAPQIENMNRELPGFFSRLHDPILVSCEADFGRINDTNVFPKQIPDFYRGQVVTVYGRFDPKKDREFAMRLTGQAQDRKKEVVFRADLSKASKGDEDIARNWAFRKVYYLIGEATSVGETPELLAQIRALAAEYNIRTSYDQ
ncbi:MAG TPA: VWA domain-containing protein [Candidatus Hydrogenedentes bacterium]|nr:VWA domain-containing protein [Candidatus Hydrogenedentota bacterium]